MVGGEVYTHQGAGYGGRCTYRAICHPMYTQGIYRAICHPMYTPGIPWCIYHYTTLGIPWCTPYHGLCTALGVLSVLRRSPGLNPGINMVKDGRRGSRDPKGVIVVRIFCALLLRLPG